MRLFLCIILLLLSAPAVAAEQEEAAPQTAQPSESKKIDAPIITYAQKVEIVIPIQQNPMVMTATVEQEEYAISLNLTVHNNLSVEDAKAIGSEFLIRTKNITLDDPPEKDEPGKGLYDYKVFIVRANGKTVVEGIKKSDDTKIDWSK